MEQETHVEIYRQRYETFRHLDKLRWQMLQIFVAIGSVSALVLRTTHCKADWVFFSALGLSLLFLSFAMFRIGSGIRANGKALSKFGKNIGDELVPDISSKWRSSSHWTSILVMGTGLSCIAAATIKLIY